MARKRRPSRTQAKAKAPRPSPVAEPGSTDGVVPPSDGGAQTTGRFVIVYKDSVLGAPKEAERGLREAAGIRHVVSAKDYDDDRVDPREASEAEAVYFPELGVAVVSADSDQLQSLTAEATNEESNILAIEPEYVYYALQSHDLPLQYLKGYRDAVNALYKAVAGGEEGVSEDVLAAAAFADSAQFTWGLQATRVNTSRYTGQGVKVAVLDTGMDFGHPDFRGRRFTQQSFIPGETAQDGHSHGTHCMGTSCGPQRPATGVRRYGCAFGANAFVGKVLSNQGGSAGSSVLNGMNWAIAKKCTVISMSLGAGVDQVSQAFEQIGQRALAAGCLIVAAAGNNARRSSGNFGFVEQPANSPSIMAVGALDSNLRVADFSARSSTVTGAAGKVDIAAPGVGVFSSVPVNRGTHNVFQGTSMATPHVAGIAAMWAQHTRRTGMALWTTLIQNARRIPGDARDIGAGIVQAPQ
jgi:subtilisin family serine protease